MKVEERVISNEEIRVSPDGSPRKISGYPIVFNRLSEDLGGFREQIMPGAVTEALEQDDIRFTLNHDPNYVLGRNRSGTLTLREDERGVYFENLPPDTQWARDLIETLRRQDITQMSFWFLVPPGGEKWNEDQTVRTLIRIRLRDISIATYPAYPDTEVQVRSQSHDGAPSPEALKSEFARLNFVHAARAARTKNR